MSLDRTRESGKEMCGVGSGGEAEGEGMLRSFGRVLIVGERMSCESKRSEKSCSKVETWSMVQELESQVQGEGEGRTRDV